MADTFSAFNPSDVYMRQGRHPHSLPSSGVVAHPAPFPPILFSRVSTSSRESFGAFSAMRGMVRDIQTPDSGASKKR